MIGQTPATEIKLPEVALERRRAPGAQSYWSESWQRLRRNRLAVVAAALIVLLAVVAVTAPLIAQLVHHDPSEQDLGNPFAPPQAAHWLGSDELGRDTFIRLVYGARISLGVGFLTVSLALTAGAAVGLLAAYYGGWLDDIMMRLVDTVLSIPAVFLFILMAILFRPNAITLSVIIATVSWGVIARLVRGEALAVNSREFMIAGRSIGASDRRLMLRHLLPNVLPVMIVAGSYLVGQVILAEAALDFLGLGIQAPTPSWGNMLSNAQTYFYHSAYLVYFPGLAIFLTVLAANVFGNALRDAFDPRLKNL